MHPTTLASASDDGERQLTASGAAERVFFAGTVRVWGKEKAAQRQRQLAASSEDTGITTNGASEVSSPTAHWEHQ